MTAQLIVAAMRIGNHVVVVSYPAKAVLSHLICFAIVWESKTTSTIDSEKKGRKQIIDVVFV